MAAARVFPLKDIETMIRAAEVARDTIPDVYFLVYGSLNADPPYVAKCRQLINELKLEGTFEFGGFHSKPAEIYTEGEYICASRHRISTFSSEVRRSLFKKQRFHFYNSIQKTLIV